MIILKHRTQYVETFNLRLICRRKKKKLIEKDGFGSFESRKDCETGSVRDLSLRMIEIM